MKVSLKAKPGKTISGEVNLNCIRANYDSRQIDSGFNLIDATKLYLCSSSFLYLLEEVLLNSKQILSTEKVEIIDL